METTRNTKINEYNSRRVITTILIRGLDSAQLPTNLDNFSNITTNNNAGDAQISFILSPHNTKVQQKKQKTDTYSAPKRPAARPNVPQPHPKSATTLLFTSSNEFSA